jgi:hypothetical protein
MSSTKAALQLPRQRRPLAALTAAIVTPRFAVYMTCVLATLLLSCFLGKDMTWDTLDYHLYAGFSALHDRFSQDYFAAGSQSYFNPYVYVPFYLLATSRLTALAAASILAVLQSGLLWLSYELALAVVPQATARTRIAIGVCAVLLSLANPILINELGASSADVITAEIVLAGWLLLVHAVQAPGHAKLLGAGLLLGAASALKLTNSLHALSGCLVLLFLPAVWRMRLRYSAFCLLAMACGFLLLAVPWAVHLERHFGNPLFPLFNGVFRSSQFPTSHIQDLRFVPGSLSESLWRPLAIAAPVNMVDAEFSSPDLRYAVLMALAALALLRWSLRLLRRPAGPAAPAATCQPARPLFALGGAFLLDWALWLGVSGNGRYFIPMACVAAVLAVALLFRLLAARTKARNYLIAAIFAAQALEVCAGATYRDHVAWDGGPWFEVSVPERLATQPDLYFAFAEQSNSFIAPFLAPDSGLINVDGGYVLGSQEANGQHVRSLISRYASHLRTLEFQPVIAGSNVVRPADLAHENDTLEHFGLRVDAGDCARIALRDVAAPWVKVFSGDAPTARVAQSPDRFLVTCRIVPNTSGDSSLIANERRADLAFDRLERACPELFQPAGPVTLDFGDARQGYSWMRKYGNTGLRVLIIDDIVKFIDPLRGGPAVYLGREGDWDKSMLSLSCWRRDERYHAALR